MSAAINTGGSTTGPQKPGTARPPEPLAWHLGYARMFAPGKLTLGAMTPLEPYGEIPSMRGHREIAKLAEEAGLTGLWLRDVPLRDPSFGDVGQIYDPFVYLGYLTAVTETIALATAAVVVPLRYPLHLAKMAASVDQLSGGRMVLGVATGDRPGEFPAFGVDFEGRSATFREVLSFFRRTLEEEFPRVDSPLGSMSGLDLLPKPVVGRLPLIVVGNSRQTPEWIAQHADGWYHYPRSLEATQRMLTTWRELTARLAPGVFKPYLQGLMLDLKKDPGAKPEPILWGFSTGRNFLIEYIESLRELGISHVGLEFRMSQRHPREVLDELGEHVVPHFPPHPVPERSGDGR